MREKKIKIKVIIKTYVFIYTFGHSNFDSDC